jgi:8-oxo-dGTP pyrophosphatase MutT (NUDIX family)
MSKRKRETADRGDRTASNRVNSYGILLYKQDSDSNRFLLGLIPQRNWWTVFKGLPEGDETPHETAIREFHEETGISNAFPGLSPETTLHATVGSGKTAKDLHVYLVKGSHIKQSSFNANKVVKIDQGYMKGAPEIVEIRWMTLEEALDGNGGAKIYTSQQQLLRDAHKFLCDKKAKTPQKESDSDDTTQSNIKVLCKYV